MKTAGLLGLRLKIKVHRWEFDGSKSITSTLQKDSQSQLVFLPTLQALPINGRY